MNTLFWRLLIIAVFVLVTLVFWIKKDRKYKSSNSVASAYDEWTNDRLLERLWGEHIHLGYYSNGLNKKDFRRAKVDLVHELIQWSGMDKLPRGANILDVGCGIGGSARILAKELLNRPSSIFTTQDCSAGCWVFRMQNSWWSTLFEVPSLRLLLFPSCSKPN